jgi:hypothetical protein
VSVMSRSPYRDDVCNGLRVHHTFFQNSIPPSLQPFVLPCYIAIQPQAHTLFGLPHQGQKTILKMFSCAKIAPPLLPSAQVATPLYNLSLNEQPDLAAILPSNFSMSTPSNLTTSAIPKKYQKDIRERKMFAGRL